MIETDGERALAEFMRAVRHDDDDDDIYIYIYIYTSSSEEATAIYEKFQNIDRHIQFKIEHSDNAGSLSLLDFKMQISPTGKIYTGFYRKPTTKILFEYFISTLPFSAKGNYIRNEIKRIHNWYSEEKDKITHTAHFINRNNDYATSITRHLNN